MMAESKFTKGPWVAKKVIAANKIYWSIHTENQFIASTGYLGISLGEQEANAELMADAPRMLEVLRALCESTVAHEEDVRVATKAFADAERLLEKHGG
jgi:hypothetical protein